MAGLSESAQRRGKAAQPALLEASYVHHVRGRLRARFDRLIGDTPAMEAAELRLSAVPGVRTVSGNHLLGSLIVQYDPLVLPSEQVPEVLEEQGFAIGRMVAPPPSSVLAPLAETALAAASRGLVDALVHRAVLAVILG